MLPLCVCFNNQYVNISISLDVNPVSICSSGVKGGVLSPSLIECRFGFMSFLLNSPSIPLGSKMDEE